MAFLGGKEVFASLPTGFGKSFVLLNTAMHHLISPIVLTGSLELLAPAQVAVKNPIDLLIVIDRRFSQSPFKLFFGKGLSFTTTFYGLFTR